MSVIVEPFLVKKVTSPIFIGEKVFFTTSYSFIGLMEGTEFSMISGHTDFPFMAGNPDGGWNILRGTATESGRGFWPIVRPVLFGSVADSGLGSVLSVSPGDVDYLESIGIGIISSETEEGYKYNPLSNPCPEDIRYKNSGSGFTCRQVIIYKGDLYPAEILRGRIISYRGTISNGNISISIRVIK